MTWRIAGPPTAGTSRTAEAYSPDPAAADTSIAAALVANVNRPRGRNDEPEGSR